MTMDEVSIGWHGLPAYAARLIKAAGGDFSVIASRPRVPIQGMDDILPCRIRWIEEGYTAGWEGLALSVPRLYFQPSWSTPVFNRLGDEVRAAGGKVVVMFDNPWRGDLRQILGAIRFRTQWRNKFCAAWVAGESGKKLARFWGFADADIYTGMYGADPSVFADRPCRPLHQRPKRFIFVARLVKEKGVEELVAAWDRFYPANTDWELHVYGVGPLQSMVEQRPGLRFHGFQQPEVIAAGMSESRFLILPSHLEHWGLVVCEAAQAGCGLLLSESVGSALDFEKGQEGLIFKSENIESLVAAMTKASRLKNKEADNVQTGALEASRSFTPEGWASTFAKLCGKYSTDYIL